MNRPVVRNLARAFGLFWLGIAVVNAFVVARRVEGSEMVERVTFLVLGAAVVLATGYCSINIVALTKRTADCLTAMMWIWGAIAIVSLTPINVAGWLLFVATPARWLLRRIANPPPLSESKPS